MARAVRWSRPRRRCRAARARSTVAPSSTCRTDLAFSICIQEARTPAGRLAVHGVHLRACSLACGQRAATLRADLEVELEDARMDVVAVVAGRGLGPCLHPVPRRERKAACRASHGPASGGD